MAAVQTIGPRAQSWAAKTRDAYPTASAQALARLAKQQFTRFGGLGSVFGAVAGTYAPITLLGTAAITHAELILHLAAAYGLDPTDPRRAADLLLITRVHPTRSDAEAALEAARRHGKAPDGKAQDGKAQDSNAQDGKALDSNAQDGKAQDDKAQDSEAQDSERAHEDGGLRAAVWRLGRMVAVQTGGWAALRLVNRYFPGTSLLAAVLTSTASTQAVASRAEAYYRR
ncbi:hypothetical protein [Paractinoplanes rhizophilus]|uniref:hypothetical protein n=1 Tax=Paractinoplanes rhizophilus TaxID=1416877 RepID=UPI00366DA74F